MFKSDRDIKLITQKKDKRKTIITFEDWSKWYKSYLINPDGTVAAFEPDYNSDIGKKYIDAWKNHSIIPKVFAEVAAELNFVYDNKTFNAVVEHFVSEYLDGDRTKLDKYMSVVQLEKLEFRKTQITEQLYTIRKDVVCLKCGCKGAILSYGNYYPNGLGDEVDAYGEISHKYMEKYRNNPYMSNTMRFGGTIPYECLNCGNSGLVDMGGLEGYKKAFRSFKVNKE